MRLHARHGWSYQAVFWDPLAKRLGPIRADDRGYYGAARPDPISDDVAHVLIGHSLGALRMLAEAGPACRGLVVINGFDRFVATDGLDGVAPRVLERMIRRCAADPDDAAARFRARCGDTTAPAGPTTSRLLADLHRLSGPAADCPPLPLLRLDGARDPLLSAAHRAACFGGTSAIDVEDGGHLLPLTHPGRCADAIAGFLATLR